MVALCQYQGRYDATRTAVPTWAHLLVHALPGVLAVLEVLEGLVPGRRTIMVSNVEKSERLRKTRRGLQPHEEKLAVRMPRPSLLLRHVPPPWDSVGFQAFQKVFRRACAHHNPQSVLAEAGSCAQAHGRLARFYAV